MAYTRSEIARHFDTTPETIRRWSRDFENYLSPLANDANKSQYSDDDMRVLSFVSAMYTENKKTEEIAASLASGSRGEWDGYLLNRTMELDEKQIVQLQDMEVEVQTLKSDLQEALTKLAIAESKVRDTESLRTEINDLNRQIGKYQILLEMNGIDPTTGKKLGE